MPSSPALPATSSLRAAEEQTGHNYETIAAWIKRFGGRAQAINDFLARDLHLTEVEVDELWSFVGKKSGTKHRKGKATLVPTRTPANGGAA